MKYVKPQQTYPRVHPVNLLAQIDLFRILLRAGRSCSLFMYDKISCWVLHYSRKEPKKNLWTKYHMESQKSLIEKMSNILDTGGHNPVSKDVFSPYDSRIISVPVFSFVNQVMYLLSNPRIMPNEYLIKDYAIFTGKCGTDF